MNIGILMAAGKGSRLAPLTLQTPKPLLPIAKSTLLQRNMDRALPLVDAFVIVIGWLGEKIEHAIGSNYGGRPVYYARQANPAGGTMDAVRAAVRAADAQGFCDANFFVMNSDDIHGPDIFEQFAKNISTNPGQALVAAKIIEDHEAISRFAAIEIKNGNLFSRVVEKPQTFVSELVNIGIYYFPARIRDFIPDASVNPGKEEFITDHLLNPFSHQYGARVISTDDVWLPVNSHEEYAHAQEVMGA